VDSDNRIRDAYPNEAASLLKDNPNLDVIYADAEYCGDRNGWWQMPEFDLLFGGHRSAASQSSGKYREARWLYWESASRLVRLMPLRVLVLSWAAYGGYWCVNHWNQLTMSLAIRTRVRRLIKRVRPAA
jgi:hypothetical protein